MVFLPHIRTFLNTADRLDIIWDVYGKDSLKNSIRAKHGTRTCRQVTPEGKVPSNWNHDFLRNSVNKTELFEFLSAQVLNKPYPAGKDVCDTGPGCIMCTWER